MPGSLGQTYSEGCNKLIRNNKAVIYTSIKDLEYHMNWSVEETPTAKKNVMETDFNTFSPDEQTVLRILKEKNGPMMIDELTIKSSLSPSLLASLLLTLEFSDTVKSLPGKQFALKKK